MLTQEQLRAVLIVWLVATDHTLESSIAAVKRIMKECGFVA
jgi:hypothetical protein